MAANALKTQEIRLDELKTDRIWMELQLSALEQMNEEINIMDSTEVYNWTMKHNGDYAMLRGILRCVYTFEEAYKILKDETEKAVQKEMEAELHILRNHNKNRIATLDLLDKEITENSELLMCKEHDNQMSLFFGEEIEKKDFRAERELELRHNLLLDIFQTLLGK